MDSKLYYWALPVTGNLQTSNLEQYKHTHPKDAAYAIKKELLRLGKLLVLNKEEEHMSGDAFLRSVNEHVKPTAQEKGLIFSVSDQELSELSPQSANNMTHYIEDFNKYKDLGILPPGTELEFAPPNCHRYGLGNFDHHRMAITNTSNSNRMLNSVHPKEVLQAMAPDFGRRFPEIFLLHEGIHGVMAGNSGEKSLLPKGVPFLGEGSVLPEHDIVMEQLAPRWAYILKGYEASLKAAKADVGESSVDFVSEYLTEYHKQDEEEFVTTASEMMHLRRLEQTQANDYMAQQLGLRVDKVQDLIDQTVGKPFTEKEIKLVNSLEKSFKTHMPAVHQFNEAIAKNWDDVVPTLLHWAIKPGGLNKLV
ncbi:MAG: hypothetical protein HEQ32_06430 [Vampirovibrio sp.]